MAEGPVQQLLSHLSVCACVDVTVCGCRDNMHDYKI